MKYICKTAEPEAFRRWKTRNKDANKWDDLPIIPERRELRKHLINEQLGMCCYCEMMISLEESHIEHLKPKGNPSYRKDMFSYGNLLASCNGKDSRGNKKQNWYEPEMVSPLDKNCADRFRYNLQNGRITPSDETDTWAETSIEKLGLNCRRLKDRRKSIIMGLENVGEAYLERVMKNTLEGEKEWPFGFFTVLFYVAESWDISI